MLACGVATRLRRWRGRFAAQAWPPPAGSRQPENSFTALIRREKNRHRDDRPPDDGSQALACNGRDSPQMHPDDGGTSYEDDDDYARRQYARTDDLDRPRDRDRRRSRSRSPQRRRSRSRSPGRRRRSPERRRDGRDRDRDRSRNDDRAPNHSRSRSRDRDRRDRDRDRDRSQDRQRAQPSTVVIARGIPLSAQRDDVSSRVGVTKDLPTGRYCQ